MLASRHERAHMAPAPDDLHQDVLDGARRRAGEIIQQARRPRIPPQIDRQIRSRFDILCGEPPEF